jgi:hypothetical protein
VKHIASAMRRLAETPPLMDRLNDHLRVGRIHLNNRETVDELRALAVEAAEALVDRYPTLGGCLRVNPDGGPDRVDALLRHLGTARHALIATGPPYSPVRPDFGPLLD